MEKIYEVHPGCYVDLDRIVAIEARVGVDDISGFGRSLFTPCVLDVYFQYTTSELMWSENKNTTGKLTVDKHEFHYVNGNNFIDEYKKDPIGCRNAIRQMMLDKWKKFIDAWKSYKKLITYEEGKELTELLADLSKKYGIPIITAQQQFNYPQECNMVDGADVRNKLGPMQTVLDLIQEDSIVPKDQKLNKLWHEVIVQAQVSIEYIKKLGEKKC